MRKMKNVKTGQVLNITEHIIIKNLWEYYVTDDKFDDDIVQCFVMGFENELGDVYMPEIEPYIISKTKKLNEIAPAHGFEWVK